MPNYTYECKKCGEFTTWQSMQDDALTVGECGHKVVKVLGPVRTGNLSPITKDADAKEAGWSKDMPAYKRFRDKGYQPPAIDGCDHLEATAKSDIWIKSGGRMKYSDERVNESKELANDIMKGRA